MRTVTAVPPLTVLLFAGPIHKQLSQLVLGPGNGTFGVFRCAKHEFEWFFTIVYFLWFTSMSIRLMLSDSIFRGFPMRGIGPERIYERELANMLKSFCHPSKHIAKIALPGFYYSILGSAFWVFLIKTAKRSFSCHFQSHSLIITFLKVTICSM